MATPTRRLRTRLWASLIVVLALLAVAGAAWINYTSPRYSVGQLARAAADGDWDGVQKYVDVEAVVSHRVDAATMGTFGGGDSWLGAVGAKLAESAKPGLTQGASNLLRTGIEMGPDRPNAAVDLAGLFALKSVKSVTYAGDQALVTVAAPYGKERTIDVTLRMKRVDNFWRVIAVEDSAALETGEDH